MDENRLTYKKKSCIFACVIILTDYLVRSGANKLVAHLTASGSADVNGYNTVNQITGVALSVFSLVFILLASYIFTKDKRKTVIFAGSIYFGKELASLVSSLISTVANILTSTMLISPKASSVIITAGDIIVKPLIIALAYFAFTAFEGINTKLEGRSLNNSGMLFSQARKRYLTAYLLVHACLTSYGIIDADKYGIAFQLSAQIIGWLSTLIRLSIFYHIGYKACKNPLNGISFISISGFAGAVSGVFLNMATLPLNIILNSVGTTENIALIGTLSGIAGVTSIVALASDIISAIYFLKFFFPKFKISLFTEESYSPEFSIKTESDQEILG